MISITIHNIESRVIYIYWHQSIYISIHILGHIRDIYICIYICTHGTYVWHIRSCKQGFSHMFPIFPNDGGTRVSSRGPHPLSEALRDLGRLALENLLRWGIEDIRFGPCTGIFRMRICMQFHANIGNVYNSLSGFIMIYQNFSAAMGPPRPHSLGKAVPELPGCRLLDPQRWDPKSTTIHHYNIL